MLIRIIEINAALVLNQISFFFLPSTHSFDVFWDEKFVLAGKFLNPRFPCTTHQSWCPLVGSSKSFLLAFSKFLLYPKILIQTPLFIPIYIEGFSRTPGHPLFPENIGYAISYPLLTLLLWGMWVIKNSEGLCWEPWALSSQWLVIPTNVKSPLVKFKGSTLTRKASTITELHSMSL